jgi:DNA polymerase (family 10)
MDFLHLRAALEKGALIAINPDAHEADGMEYMKYGIQMARKAGAIAEQVINCQSLDTVMKIFKKQQTNSVTF